MKQKKRGRQYVKENDTRQKSINVFIQSDHLLKGAVVSWNLSGQKRDHIDMSPKNNPERWLAHY